MNNQTETVVDLRKSLAAKDVALASITSKIEALIGEVKAIRKMDATPTPVPHDPAPTQHDASQFLAKAATIQGTLDRLAADVATLERRYAGERRR